jgi:hypothetical protein
MDCILFLLLTAREYSSLLIQATSTIFFSISSFGIHRFHNILAKNLFSELVLTNSISLNNLFTCNLSSEGVFKSIVVFLTLVINSSLNPLSCFTILRESFFITEVTQSIDIAQFSEFLTFSKISFQYFL